MKPTKNETGYLFLTPQEKEEIETEWRSSSLHYSNEELLKIFPEARIYLKERLTDIQIEIKKLTDKIRKDLKWTYSNKSEDKFWTWFFEKITEVWLGEELNKLNKEKTKILWQLAPKKLGSEISEDEIERARSYPITQLLEENGVVRGKRKNFFYSIWHNEKNPSMFAKPDDTFAYDFSTGKSIDAIGYLMEFCDLTFVEAVKRLQ